MTDELRDPLENRMGIMAHSARSEGPPAAATSRVDVAPDQVAPRQVFVNGEARATTAVDLAAWIAEAGLQPERVATALNGGFVARDRRAAQPLRDGDRIDVFQAIVGG